MAYSLIDIRSRVRTKIKDTAYPASTIDSYINDAIGEIASLYPFKQFQKVVDGSLSIGEYVYLQQEDHESTIRLILIDPVTTTSFFDMTARKVTSDRFFDLYGVPDANANGQPSYWTEYGNQMYFNCPANKSYTLRQFYQKTPTELELDGDVPELPLIFRESIVLGAAYRCEEERGNYDISAILQNRFADKTGDLMMRFANDSLGGPDTIIRPGWRGNEIYR